MSLAAPPCTGGWSQLRVMRWRGQLQTLPARDLHTFITRLILNSPERAEWLRKTRVNGNQAELHAAALVTKRPGTDRSFCEVPSVSKGRMLAAGVIGAAVHLRGFRAGSWEWYPATGPCTHQTDAVPKNRFRPCHSSLCQKNLNFLVASRAIASGNFVWRGCPIPSGTPA